MVRYLAFAAAAVTMVAATVWFFSPPRHEAFALVRIARESPSVLANQPVAASEEFDIFKRTQVQMVLSGRVLGASVRDPKIAKLPMIERHGEEARAWLRDHLVVDYPGDAEIMRITLAGEKSDELVRVVDAVVKKYLSEVVAAGREERLQQEGRLEKRYADTLIEFTRKSEALHRMEQVAKVGSSAAEVQRKLAVETLDDAIATRNFLNRQILENEIKANLLKAQGEMPPEKRTAETGAEDTAELAGEKLSVQVLEKQRDFLRERLDDANAQIEQAARQFDELETFSANVAAKREELAALKQILTEIKARLDRTMVDRLAQERITLVDEATLATDAGDSFRRYVGLSAATAVSLGLVAIGLAARRRRQS